jgi:ABC-type sugar transport system ATPase subunit
MIQIVDLHVHIGDFRLAGISLEVPTGEYAVLMGKTGSGKTTVLECLCGLRSAESGRILLGGKDVTERRPAERDIGYVPQDGALFTTMTVRQHLEFPLSIRKWKRHAIDRRTAELAELLGIEHLLGRRPQGLSGGESQRVALGRALAFHPSTLVLDEPLSALDDDSREQMYGLLKQVQQHFSVTALHITHSRVEASRLCDRLLVLQDGRVRLADSAELTLHDDEDVQQAEETHST